MSFDDHDRCRRCGAPDDGHSRDACDQRNAARVGAAAPRPAWEQRYHDATIAFEGARTRLAAIEAERPDPMTEPHVDHALPIVGGSIQMQSASGGLESLWIRLLDEHGLRVAFDRATGQHLAAAVRVTPSQARALAALLTRYADSHRDSR